MQIRDSDSKRKRTVAAEQVFNQNVRLCVVSPNGLPGHFAAAVNGLFIVLSSRQPLLDTCRALLADGADPNSWVIMRHAGSDVDALRGKVGLLARLTIEESAHGPVFRSFRDARRVRWRPRPSRRARNPTGL